MRRAIANVTATMTERARFVLPPTTNATATVTALAIAVEEPKPRAFSKAAQSSSAPGENDAPGGKKQAVPIATARSHTSATAAVPPRGLRSRQRPAIRGESAMVMHLDRDSHPGPRPLPPGSRTVGAVARSYLITEGFRRKSVGSCSVAIGSPNGAKGHDAARADCPIMRIMFSCILAAQISTF